MERYLVRVWLPDRPGALGAVASRIGAVRGDVVGIDILETGGGEAIDELVVQLPKATPVGLLVSEVEEVDGVRVEEMRPLTGPTPDPRLDAWETAAVLVSAQTTEDVLTLLCEHARRSLMAEWVAVVDGDDEVVERVGGVPPTGWLAAFLAGSRSALADCDTDDVVWAPLASAGLSVVAGRNGSAYRARERGQLAALARIADACYAHSRERSTARSHCE